MRFGALHVRDHSEGLMSAEHPQDLDLNIARARLILAPATFLSIYLDAAKPDHTPWFRLTGG
jgi:hypothetical protein